MAAEQHLSEYQESRYPKREVVNVTYRNSVHDVKGIIIPYGPNSTDGDLIACRVHRCFCVMLTSGERPFKASMLPSGIHFLNIFTTDV
jgi:hypothetical protein